jgi:hypothetical protein
VPLYDIPPLIEVENKSLNTPVCAAKAVARDHRRDPGGKKALRSDIIRQKTTGRNRILPSRALFLIRTPARERLPYCTLPKHTYTYKI